MNREDKAECLQTVREALSKWDKSKIIKEMEGIHDVIDVESNINPRNPEKEYKLKNKLGNEETGWIDLFSILICYETCLDVDEVNNKYKKYESTVYIEDLYERIIANEEEVSLQYVVDNYPLNRQYKRL